MALGFGTFGNVNRQAFRVVPEPVLPTLTPEDEESILGSLAGDTLSGAAWVGGTLDKLFGGRAVRNIVDALTGGDDWSAWEMLSILPGSDMLGITDPEQQVTGYDILENLGVENQPGFDLTDILSFGVEAGLDPATYLSLGGAALGKAGQAAKKAGMLDDLLRASDVGKTTARVTPLGQLADPAQLAELSQRTGMSVADLGNETLGGLAGFGVPFKAPSTVVGASDLGRKAAGVWDAVKQGARHGYVPGTAFSPGDSLAQLFSHEALGALTTTGQQAAAPLARTLRDVQAEAISPIVQAAERLHALGPQWQGSGLDTVRKLRRMAEGVDAAPPEIADILQPVQDEFKLLRQTKQEWGLPGGQDLDDDIAEYWSRYLSGVQGYSGKAAEVLGVAGGQTAGRLQALKNLGEGTDTVVQIATDPAFVQVRQQTAHLPVADRADAIEQWLKQSQYAPQVPASYQQILNGTVADVDQPKELARILAGLPDEAVASGVFGNHPLADALRYNIGSKERIALGQHMLTTLVDPDTLDNSLREAQRLGRGETTTIGQLLDGLGYTPAKVELQQGGGFTLLPGYDTKLADLLGVQLNPADLDQVRGALSQIRDRAIPKPFAEDLARTYQYVSGPAGAGKILSAVDSLTSVFKAGVLTWPARFVRDLVSGQAQSAMLGLFNPRTAYQTARMTVGRTFHGAEQIPYIANRLAAEGLAATADNATAMLRRVLAEQGVTGRGQQELASRAIRPEGSLESILARLPGHGRQGAGDVLGEMGRKATFRHPSVTYNPLDIRGVGERTETTFGVSAAAEDLGHVVETLNRAPPFVELLKKGYAPEEARRIVDEMQVDYTKFGPTGTPFQQQVMTRLFPFYRFTRGQLPFVFRELTEHPGGGLAQSINAANAMRDTGAPIPEHIAETLSIPLGTNEDGSQRYLTGLGLMPEPVLELAGQNPLLQLVSQLNPLVKAPLEHAFDESSFQVDAHGGRPLRDMDPTIGRILGNLTGSSEPVATPQLLEELAANSPAARALTTARTLTDPRKSWEAALLNTTTGARVTDVSPESQQAVAQRALEGLMQREGAASFVNTYFREDYLDSLAPSEAARNRQLMAYKNELAKRARKRAEARAAATPGY